MNQPNQNECPCQKTSCGCAGAKVARCACGESCQCQPCRCGSCGCAD